MSKPKALIYVRVSTRNQAQSGHGLESQEKRCRDHAASRGYDVIATFSDTISGGIDYAQRPGMTALLAFLDGQTSERYIVLFDDPKRFARSTRFHLELREALRRRDAIIECLNFKFEDDSPEGEFIETIIAAQGQLERKQNGRQVAQKMRARMENGYWIHTPPIGYRYETQKGRGKVLVRNPPFDAIVKEAFEGFASGRFQTQVEVKRFFEGIPHFPRNKNGEIVQQRVTDVLTHPIYTGHICSETYEINWLKAQHEPLVSLETFDKVQERRKGKAKAPKRKNIGDAFALRGIAVCTCCEVPLRSSITKGNGGHYPYYLCQTKGCEAYGKSIKRDRLEADVGELIKALQPTEGLMTAATAMFRHIWDTRRTQAAEIVRSGKHSIASIDKEIDKLLDLIMASDNTTVIVRYEEKISQYERKKALLAEKLSNQVEPDGTWEEKLEPALLLLANPWKLWETGNITLRRAVLKLAFKDRIHYCRNKGARTPEIALPFKSLGAFSDLGVCFGAGERT